MSETLGQDVLEGRLSLEDVAAHALKRNVDERPVSGRQEQLENLVNDYIC